MITAEQLRAIAHFTHRTLPVTSLYVGVPTVPEAREVRTRVASLADQIRPLGGDPTLPHEARLSIRADLERIEALVSGERWAPGALAVFACGGAGFFEVVSVPRRVRDRVVVDRSPWVRPLEAVLEEYHRVCVVVLTRKTARLWDLYQQELHEVTEVEDRTLRKPDYAGWYGLQEHRVANKAATLERKHYATVAQLVDRLFRDDDYEMLILGGHSEQVSHFLGFLSRERRGQVIGSFPFDVGTENEATIRERASGLLERFERDEEQRLVAEVLEAAAAGRPAATGLRPTLWAATLAAVADLLVHDEAMARGVVCDDCGWLGETGTTCPMCGSEVRQTPDVIDELTVRVIDDGGSVEHVEAKTDLEPFQVAARLRFRLPPDPSEAPADSSTPPE